MVVADIYCLPRKQHTSLETRATLLLLLKKHIKKSGRAHSQDPRIVPDFRVTWVRPGHHSFTQLLSWTRVRVLQEPNSLCMQPFPEPGPRIWPVEGLLRPSLPSPNDSGILLFGIISPSPVRPFLKSCMGTESFLYPVSPQGDWG